MIYELHIGIKLDRKHKAVLLKPAVIETITESSEKVSINEIKMVADAFSLQLERHIKKILGKNIEDNEDD